MTTKIAWTDETWNPVTGCTPVSEGCAYCYARTFAERFRGVPGHPYEQGFDLVLHPDRLEIPLHWKKPRLVFVPSMGDLFHEDVPDEFVWKVFGAMAAAGQHAYQVLTKRPQRMREMLSRVDYPSARGSTWGAASYLRTVGGDEMLDGWPLPNVWLGVSVENQARADERIPLLLDTPAAVRFVSCEPLLGPVDLHGSRWLFTRDHLAATFGNPSIDWVIVGGESGGPPERRLVEQCHMGRPPLAHIHIDGHDVGHGCNGWQPKPEALEWVRSIRDQCQAAGAPFFFKQWGPKAGQGTLLDGREHKEMPR